MKKLDSVSPENLEEPEKWVLTNTPWLKKIQVAKETHSNEVPSIHRRVEEILNECDWQPVREDMTKHKVTSFQIEGFDESLSTWIVSLKYKGKLVSEEAERVREELARRGQIFCQQYRDAIYLLLP